MPAPITWGALEIGGGVVVDVAARRLVHTLTAERPRFEALDERSAYLVGRDGAVQAFDLATGSQRWRVKPDHCTAFALTKQEVHCVDDMHVHSLDKSDGKIRKRPGFARVWAIVGVEDHLLIHRGGEIESFADGATSNVARTPVFAGMQLHAHGADVCAAHPVTGGIFAQCWSKTLVSRWLNTFVVAKPGEPRGEWQPRFVSRFVVASRPLHMAKGSRRTLVVDLATGDEHARIEAPASALVVRGADVDGVVELETELRTYDRAGLLEWTSPALGNSAATVTLGDRLFVATHHAISSGAKLSAFDRTGKLLWSTRPSLPPIEHSEYANRVTLSAAHGVLVMRGEESAVTYLSLFDPVTGRAILEVVK